MIKQLFLIVLLFVVGNRATAQVATPALVQADSLPYLKYPTLPAFNILLPDSSTIFNTYNIPKGRPVVLMLFDPDCSHCKKLTQAITTGIDSLKGMRFYLVTANHSMQAIKKYSEDFQLSKYGNIEAIGRDYEFFFTSFYGVRSVPAIAIYDSKKKIVKLIDAHVTIEELYKYTRGLH
jgi:thioredoxin-related protein